LTEARLQTTILKYIESLPNTWTVKILSCNKNGTPDILCCINGRFIAFEVKSPSGKGVISKLQLYRVAEIQASGGEAYFVKSLGEVKGYLS